MTLHTATRRYLRDLCINSGLDTKVENGKIIVNAVFGRYVIYYSGGKWYFYNFNDTLDELDLSDEESILRRLRTLKKRVDDLKERWKI